MAHFCLNLPTVNLHTYGKRTFCISDLGPWWPFGPTVLAPINWIVIMISEYRVNVRLSEWYLLRSNFFGILPFFAYLSNFSVNFKLFSCLSLRFPQGFHRLVLVHFRHTYLSEKNLFTRILILSFTSNFVNIIRFWMRILILWLSGVPIWILIKEIYFW